MEFQSNMNTQFYTIWKIYREWMSLSRVLRGWCQAKLAAHDAGCGCNVLGVSAPSPGVSSEDRVQRQNLLQVRRTLSEQDQVSLGSACLINYTMSLRESLWQLERPLIKELEKGLERKLKLKSVVCFWTEPKIFLFSCLDIPVTPLRRLGVVRIGAEIVMAVSSGNCAQFRM